jgi:aspartate aminotransferase-like enzyme
MKPRTKLMIPGPIDIWEETLEALSEPVRPHYGEEFMTIYRDTVAMLRQVFQTKNDILIMTAPGSGALDAGLAGLFSPHDRVAVVDNGPFAERLIDILAAYQCEVIPVEDAWGKAGDVDRMRSALKANRRVAGLVVVANDTGTGVRNPVREYAEVAREFHLPIFVDGVSAMGGYDVPVDEWGLDVVVTSSNKALETTPGLGIISVSDRAWEIIRSKNQTVHRGWYYDLARWKQCLESSPEHPYPTTQASSLIVSLYTSLKRILQEETLHGHWARYAWAQGVVRAGLRAMGFEPVAADDIASYTVTTFWIREDIRNRLELRDYLLQKHGFLIATAMGEFAFRVLRIGHMGKAGSRDYLVPCLLGIEDFVRQMKGADLPHGAGLAGFKTSERWY